MVRQAWYQKHWDRLGILLSVLCVLHCLAAPVLGAYLSAFGMEFFPEDFTHRALLFLLVGAGFFAFLPGFRRHRNVFVLVVAGVGFLGIFFAAFFVHEVMGHAWELPINLLGSTCLITAHTLNYQCCQRCVSC